MPRASVPCASCTKPLVSHKGSLPAGVRTCRPCRAALRSNGEQVPGKIQSPCRVCGGSLPPRSADGKASKRTTCSPACTSVALARGRRSRRTCEVCGQPYRYTYSKQRTCGRACGVALRRSTVASTLCTQCGMAFETNVVGGVRRKTCGPNCPATPARPERQVGCIVCGQAFVPSACASQICSAACRAERKRQHDRRYNAECRPSADPTCSACGTAIARGRKKCDDCVQAHRSQRRRQDKRRRRALKLGVQSEPYTLAYIAERDHFRCGLCRKRVAMTRKVPHPKAPTIDHILPLSLGGSDTKANVQLACFQCNVRKSDGTGPCGDQLLLVG